MDTHSADKIPLYQTQYTISTTKFVLLNIFTFNLYTIWWTYKTWCFIKERDQSNISPELRTLFFPFTSYLLFTRIKAFAQSNRIDATYSPGLLCMGVILTLLFAFLPGYLAYTPLFCFYFFMRPFEALNKALSNSQEYIVEYIRPLNNRQLLLIIAGFPVWIYLFFTMLVNCL
jgi:hypothetical protein